jgi:serine/threonine protein kinase/class 3 adenylate cyclase
VKEWCLIVDSTSANSSHDLVSEETVLYSNLKPTNRFEAAMLLVDIVSSTHLILHSGDTVFINRMHLLHTALTTHPSAAMMHCLESTGDGYKVVYKTLEAAIEAARSLQLLQDEAFQLRFVTHSGSVKVGPNGAPLGAEVHRLFRVEAIEESDRVSDDSPARDLPKHGRIIITRAGFDRLASGLRSEFELIGYFRLKGFEEPEEIWAEKAAQGIGDNPLSRIVAAAVEIQSSDKREKFIREACTGDEALLKEVRELLRYAKIERDLERLAEEESSLIGKSIGNYRIKQEIGRGGMGAVYLGERTKDFNHLAAIKVINQGGLTREDLRRFGREMRIVASLDHPNIARLIDGGVTKAKLPFFVMDYVAGSRVTEFCDENRLTVKERLELFRKICSVVEYLHGKGVIHRDIKPSNIIVATGGEPKMIDFGIAQVINSAAVLGKNDLTSLLQSAFSRDYASPEQVRGDRDIEKSTDVYSLGALLYELLTGHKPHRFISGELSEVLRVICEVEPIKPSNVILQEPIPTAEIDQLTKSAPEIVSAVRHCTPKQLSRALSGDLDSIIIKALRKEPQRRYRSVQELIIDVDNYLQGRPVIARKGSWWHHLDSRAHRFFGKLPPAKLGWAAKAIIYLSLIVFCLAAVQFPRLKRWTLIVYTMTISGRTNSQRISLSSSGTQRAKAATEMLVNHLGLEVNAPRRNPNAWTMSQMVTALEGRSAVNIEYVRSFLAKLVSTECGCWRESPSSPKDLRVSSWVLLGMSRLGLSVNEDQLDFLLNTIHADGWWPIYTEYPKAEGIPITQEYASTYATAMAVLSLQAQSELGKFNPDQNAKVKDALKRGRIWLLKTRMTGEAKWWDYPFNESRSYSLGISGLVLHVLHRTTSTESELKEIDEVWLHNLPNLEMNANARESSQVVVDAFTLRDPSTQFPLQWSIIATADAYASGSSLQRAEAVVWLDNIARNFEELATGVIGNIDWTASELLVSLRYLQDDKII